MKKYLLLALLLSALVEKSFAYEMMACSEKAYADQTFYLGSRYFFNPLIADKFWGNVSPFIGSKGAFVWHQTTSARLCPLGATFHKKQLSSSSGAHVGLDFGIGSDWGLIFTAEAAKKKMEPGLHLDSKDSLEVSFPVTFGLRFKF